MSFQQRSVDVHDFSMIPRAEIPRSVYSSPTMRKTTFDAGYLVPFMVEEILPGDTWTVRAKIFARTATPIVPIFDNMHLETSFWFVPTRLVWTNFVKMMGEQNSPGDSISFTTPQLVSPAGGFVVCSIYDYMGLPTVGQIGGGATISVNVLPLRAYNMIYNLWFRDQNLQNYVGTVMPAGDGPDALGNFTLHKRGKRHDYFTAALPFLQKGTAVSIPLGTVAPVVSDGNAALFRNAANTRNASLVLTTGSAATTWANSVAAATSDANFGPAGTTTTGLRADLSAATAATINSLRLGIQTQRYMERDARGGTRYTEKVRSHFGVTSPDARLQRPEYLGGGHQRVNINPVEQQSATTITGSTTPAGSLAAFGTTLGDHGFSQAFTEHGYLIALVNVRADLTYQQGLRKLWTRLTALDHYWPVFSHLGEQAVLNKEIYCVGTPAQDDAVFGYQERWAEYRHNPSMVTGLFRSTSAGTLDFWHVAERFSALPTLNATFISDQTNAILVRNLAAGAQANNAQFLMDAAIDIRMARCMPTYSVPGLMDHF